jgi:hypothetical protein
VEGKGDKQIAAAMGVGLPTVRTYLTRAFQRTGVGDRVALVVRVYERAPELRKRAEEQRAMTNPPHNSTSTMMTSGMMTSLWMTSEMLTCGRARSDGTLPPRADARRAMGRRMPLITPVRSLGFTLVITPTRE